MTADGSISASPEYLCVTESLGARLAATLWDMYPERLRERCKLRGDDAPTLEAIALGRGFLAPGGVPDTLRAANILLDEFRAGKLGRVTLERT